MAESVSVIIPTRNRRHLLRRVLTPLLEDPATSEVIVVEDGGADGSWELITEWSGNEPRLKATRTSGIGCPAARQAGFKLARGDIVLLLDDDVIGEPGLVSGHLRFHATAGGDVVVGYMPVLVDDVGSQGFATKLYAETYEKHCRSWEQDPREILRRLWNGNVSVRRGLLERAGGPGGPLTFYGEDRDLGLRLLRAGGEAVFVRSLAAVHLHHRTALTFAREGFDQGRGVRLLHDLHGDILGGFDVDSYLGIRNPIAAQALRWTRRPVLGRLLRRALEVVVRIAGKLRFTWIEIETVKFWRTVERQRGLLESQP